MALNGTVNSTAYEGRYVQLTWSATQSVMNNTTTISWSLKGAGNASALWYKAGGFYVSIDGHVVCNWSTDQRITLYNGTSIASGSLTLAHDSSGEKGFTVNIQAGIYSYARNCSGTGSFTLDTIPRASQPSCQTYPYNTQNVGYFGDTITIHMNRQAKFKHTVRYVFGSTSGTIATGVDFNCQWTIPKSLINQIPNSASGTGTIYVDTYNGTTKIGTKSCSFTATVPSDVIPSVNTLSVEIDNSANSTIAKWNVYVSGYSKAKITATASGSYGSSVQSFVISGGYSTSQAGSSLSYTGPALTSSGIKTFNVVAKDSRGRSSKAQTSNAITIYPYSKPSISALSVTRSSDNPKQINIKANWNYSDVNGNNSATATIKYKRASSSGWTTYGTIEKDTEVTLDEEFQEELSYNFMIIVTDAIGNSAQEESFISTVNVLLDLRAGGKGLGVGKVAESDSMEVALDARFMGEVYIYDENGQPMTLAQYIRSVVGI